MDRCKLLDKVVDELLHTTNDSSKYETSLTITGAGGFGKTTLVKHLCHQPAVKEQFTHGFVIVELGPQANDPNVIMGQLYHLLCGENLNPGSVNYAEQEIYQITSVFYRKLLVIFDDVWHVEDALPLVKAFSGCKTILTTRMNDVERWISSQQSCVIGPMEQHEALSLLTNGIVSSSQISQETEMLLNELALDIHLWPLLLSLVRGQLSHYVKKNQLPFLTAINKLQGKLKHNGLTALDLKDIKIENLSRELAVKACIETTLDLLSVSLSKKMKMLILWTGIGTSLQTAVLKALWNISKQDAEEIIDTLWAYGLVQFTNVVVYLHLTSTTQHCVEVHAVISEYIINSIDSMEVNDLSPFVNDTHVSVAQELSRIFTNEARKQTSSTKVDFLKLHFNILQNFQLPQSIKLINMHTITNPHMIICNLKRIREISMSSSLLDINKLEKEISSLISECTRILRSAHTMCRRLNQNVQKYTACNDYDRIIQEIENYIKSYHLGDIAQKAVDLAKVILPYFSGENFDFVTYCFEDMHSMSTEYHAFRTLLLPGFKFHVETLNKIKMSLEYGIPTTDELFVYFASDKFVEDYQIIFNNYLIKLQEVAPRVANRLALEQLRKKHCES